MKKVPRVRNFATFYAQNVTESDGFENGFLEVFAIKSAN